MEVKEVAIRGRTALWVTQQRLRSEWKQFLVSHLDKSFDLVIGMNSLATPTVDAANEYNIPSLFFIRNLNISGQGLYNFNKGLLKNFFEMDFGAKVQYPLFIKNLKEFRRGMQKANIVVSNSQYVSKRLKHDFSIESEVIYPPIPLEKYRVEYNRTGDIAAVNPRNRDKGADIFFNLVENMPEENFRCAGVFRDPKFKRRAKCLDNLTYMGYCKNMREFYRQTKLVIVPSRWNEAFGRSAAEPMVSGIPVVVTDRGGLPEVVGDTGEVVSDIESTNAWKTAIRRCFEEHDPEAQKERVKKFSAFKQGAVLEKVVSKVMQD